jgi:hypothetical protein
VGVGAPRGTDAQPDVRRPGDAIGLSTDRQRTGDGVVNARGTIARPGLTRRGAAIGRTPHENTAGAANDPSTPIPGLHRWRCLHRTGLTGASSAVVGGGISTVGVGAPRGTDAQPSVRRRGDAIGLSTDRQSTGDGVVNARWTIA